MSDHSPYFWIGSIKTGIDFMERAFRRLAETPIRNYSEDGRRWDREQARRDFDLAYKAVKEALAQLSEAL